VASTPDGSTTTVTVGSKVTDESSSVVDGLELLADVGAGELLAEVVDGEVDEGLDTELLTAAAPADAVPGVGAAQATVKTETESRAAAARP